MDIGIMKRAPASATGLLAKVLIQAIHYLFASPVNIFPMSHPLDLHDFRIAKKFIHDAVIADANAVRTFGTS